MNYFDVNVDDDDVDEDERNLKMQFCCFVEIGEKMQNRISRSRSIWEKTKPRNFDMLRMGVMDGGNRLKRV